MNIHSDSHANGSIRYYYVSCHADDSARVSAVCRRMNQMGAAIWHDNGNIKGDEWVRHITGRINGCHKFILFVTRDLMARENRFVRNEFFFAKKSGKKMYAVMLDSLSAEDVDDSLKKWFYEINDICRVIHIPDGTSPAAAAGLINDVIRFAPDTPAAGSVPETADAAVTVSEEATPEKVITPEPQAAPVQVKAEKSGKKSPLIKKTAAIVAASAFGALLMILGIFLLLSSGSDDPSYFVYEEESGGIIITSLAKEDAKSVSIPKKIDGKPVIRIGESAFAGCTSLTRVKIPGTVKEIGGSAFLFCDNLTKVDIPHSVTKIGTSAFSDCTSLKEISIPKSVTEISDSTFQNCQSLRSVRIPDSVTKIGESVFLGCVSLKTIKIPQSVTFVGGNTFEGCTSLTDVSLPSNLSQVSYSLFEGCTSLTQVNIPASVKEIGDYAFSGCTKLQKAVVPDSVEIIVDSAFLDCPALTIYSKADSNAELYAQAHNIPFKAQ